MSPGVGAEQGRPEFVSFCVAGVSSQIRVISSSRLAGHAVDLLQRRPNGVPSLMSFLHVTESHVIALPLRDVLPPGAAGPRRVVPGESVLVLVGAGVQFGECSFERVHDWRNVSVPRLSVTAACVSVSMPAASSLM